jgi:hypothetical protein
VHARFFHGEQTGCDTGPLAHWCLEAEQFKLVTKAASHPEVIFRKKIFAEGHAEAIGVVVKQIIQQWFELRHWDCPLL